MDGGSSDPRLLEIAALRKRYGEQIALADVAFSVHVGEVLGIIGPNGAGKTTLLEAIAGLLPADSGRVLWQGQALGTRSGAMPSSTCRTACEPYRDQFAVQVLSFFAGVYRRSAAQMADTVQRLGLEPVLGKRVHALSKGYNRRLLLAVGLLTPHRS